MKMGGEVRVEEGFLRKELRWDERVREETVMEMIEGSDVASLDFFEGGEGLKIGVEGEGSCVVFELGSGDMKGGFIKKLEKELTGKDL